MLSLNKAPLDWFYYLYSQQLKNVFDHTQSKHDGHLGKQLIVGEYLANGNYTISSGC